MDKNQQVLASAFKKSKRKLQRIAELEITPEWTEDQIVELTKSLAEAKAIEEGVDMRDHLDGQEWYVRSLVAASAMTPQKLLDKEYEDTFADVAEEDEMVSALEALAA